MGFHARPGFLYDDTANRVCGVNVDIIVRDGAKKIIGMEEISSQPGDFTGIRITSEIYKKEEETHRDTNPELCHHINNWLQTKQTNAVTRWR